MANIINYEDIFAGTPYDAATEIYTLTMEQMDDDTLLSYCRTNTYARQLCQNDNFWLNRITQRGLSALLPYRSLYKNLRDFYLNVRKDAMYLVSELDTGIYGAFNSPIQARLHIDALVRKDHALPEQAEIDYNMLTITNKYVILLLFSNTLLTDRKDYIIFSLDRNSPKYLADVTVYPDLMSNEFIMYQYTSDFDFTTRIHSNKEYISTRVTNSGIEFLRRHRLTNVTRRETTGVQMLRADDPKGSIHWSNDSMGIHATIDDENLRTLGILLITEASKPGLTHTVATQGTTGYVIVALDAVLWLNISSMFDRQNIPDSNMRIAPLLKYGKVFPIEEMDEAITYVRNK